MVGSMPGHVCIWSLDIETNIFPHSTQAVLSLAVYQEAGATETEQRQREEEASAPGTPAGRAHRRWRHLVHRPHVGRWRAEAIDGWLPTIAVRARIVGRQPFTWPASRSSVIRAVRLSRDALTFSADVVMAVPVRVRALIRQRSLPMPCEGALCKDGCAHHGDEGVMRSCISMSRSRMVSVGDAGLKVSRAWRGFGRGAGSG